MKAPERRSAKQVERKFEEQEDLPQWNSALQQSNRISIHTSQILQKSRTDQTIHFPKKQEVTIVKVAQSRNSTVSQLSQSGVCSLSYDMIKPREQTSDFMDRMVSFFTAKSDICKCPSSNIPDTCELAKNLLGPTVDLVRLKNQYLQFANTTNQYSRQIQMDVERTVPLFAYPNKLKQLKNILSAYSQFQPQIGYTQGMNLICSALLYHADDYIAFGLLIKLINQLELKDVYMPKSPGLSKHLQLIDYMILTKLPDLYQHFCQNQITVSLFCQPWIFSLFGILIPLTNMVFYCIIKGVFLEFVFRDGWTYIYKLIIAFLVYNLEILLSEDMTGMLTILTSQNYRINNEELYTDWDELLQAALNVSISKSFIQNMHNNYNQQKQSFRI